MWLLAREGIRFKPEGGYPRPRLMCPEGCLGLPNPTTICHVPEASLRSDTRHPSGEHRPNGWGAGGAGPGESSQPGAIPMVSGNSRPRRSCGGRVWGRGAGSYLEVRAVVIVLVHHLPLPAVPDQHCDHLSPSQVCVELRGEDVDPGGRQCLWGRGAAVSGPDPRGDPPVHGQDPIGSSHPGQFASLEHLHFLGLSPRPG